MYIPKLARDAIPLIWAIHEMPAGAKHVLTYYLLHMDDQGGSMRPGVALTCNETGFKERTIAKWLHWLVVAGYLVRDGKFGYTDQYKLNCEKFGLTPEPKRKFPRKTRLKEVVAAVDEQPSAAGASRTADYDWMFRISRKMETYWKFRESGAWNAHVYAPQNDDLKEYLREYRLMLDRGDSQRGFFELSAIRAEELLLEKGVLIK